MSFPAASVNQSEHMPVSLMLLFSAIAIASFLAASVSSWRYRRAWEKGRARSSRTPFRLPAAKRLEASLYTSGGLLCFVVVTQEWKMRARLGGIILAGLALAIYRFRSDSKFGPTIDEASVLHTEPTGTRLPSATP